LAAGHGDGQRSGTLADRRAGRAAGFIADATPLVQGESKDDAEFTPRNAQYAADSFTS